VGFRQFLQVVDPGRQRIEIALRRPDPQHVQDDLGVFGIVFVPTVVECLARAGEHDRRDEG